MDNALEFYDAQKYLSPAEIPEKHLDLPGSLPKSKRIYTRQTVLGLIHFSKAP